MAHGDGDLIRNLDEDVVRLRRSVRRLRLRVEDLRATRIASAWCHKLRTWGYLATSVNTEGSRRWSRLYTVTKAGLKAREPVSRRVYARLPETAAGPRRGGRK